MGHPIWILLALLSLSVGAVTAAVAGSRDAEDRERLIAAQQLVIRGEPARAESLLRVVIGDDSSRAMALFALNILGKLRFREKEFRRAADTFERRARLSPDDPETLWYLGLAYRELGEPARALPALRRAAELDSGRADRHLFLGMTFVNLEMWKEAEVALTRSVALDSTSSVAWTMLGTAYVKMGRHEEARAALRRAHVDMQMPRFLDAPLPPPSDSPGTGESAVPRASGEDRGG